jgi:hypothetical protein
MPNEGAATQQQMQQLIGSRTARPKHERNGRGPAVPASPASHKKSPVSQDLPAGLQVEKDADPAWRTASLFRLVPGRFGATTKDRHSSALWVA